MTDFIFAYLKKALPSITWSLGSVVRELIATPTASVAEAANAALNAQTNALDVHNMVNYPEEYADNIDRIFNELRLGQTDTINSRGTVTIYVNTLDVTPVKAGTVFYYLDSVLSVDDDIYPGVYDNGKNPGKFAQIRQLAEDAYAFDVPVVTRIINQYIGQGVTLSWYNAPANVYDVKVTSPISGGVSSLTLQDKANRIKDYICSDNLSMNEGLTKVLRNNLPDIVADAAYATDVDGMSTSYVYVKTMKAPGQFKRTVQAAKINNIYHAVVNIPGVMSLVSCYYDNKLIEVNNVNIKYNTLEFDVPVASDKSSIYLDIYVYGMEQMVNVQDFLDTYTKGSPFDIVAIAPSVLELSMEFYYTGDKLDINELTYLITSIQSKPMNPVISDTIIDGILKAVGSRLSGTVVYVTTRVDGSRRRQQSTPDLSDALSEKVAVYTHINNIRAEHV